MRQNSGKQCAEVYDATEFLLLSLCGEQQREMSLVSRALTRKTIDENGRNATLQKFFFPSKLY